MKDYRNFLTVSIEKLTENGKQIRKFIGPETQLMSVIKDNGYGHGLATAWRAFDLVSDWFGVATLEEAERIRALGCKKPILVLGYVPIEQVKKSSKLEITLCGLSKNYITAVSDYCCKHNLSVQMHLKIDTGFNRFGIKPSEMTIEEIENLYHTEGIHFTGIYTHFAAAGATTSVDQNFHQRQFELFEEVCNGLEERNISLGIKHCCNSKAMLSNPEMYLDMVRVGVYLFGLGSPEDNAKLNVCAAAKWQAKIVLEKILQAGETVSYGRLFKAEKDMKIGIVAAGFGDGYFRSLGNNSDTVVSLADQKVPILGKICMDYLMIDLTNTVGDENRYVSLINEQITAYQLGKKIESTAGEILTSINKRVPIIIEEEEHA